MSDPFADAAVRVLTDEEGGPLHWTVIQDLALQRGYLDPFTMGDIRHQLLAALAETVRDGRLAKVSKGTYELPSSERA